MRRFAVAFILCFACLVAWTSETKAQRGVDWMTSNGDAQRSAWVRADAKISKESLQDQKRKPGFQLLWKLKLSNKPRGANSLTPPATLERLIGYRGFRMLGFVGGSSDAIFTIDTDLGRMEWEKKLISTATSQAGTLACPGGMTTGVARPTVAALPPTTFGGGGGRSTPARGAVGDAGQGAVTLALVRPNPPRSSTPPAQANSTPPRPPRPNPANPAGGQFGAGPFLVYALSSDGMFHSLHLSNGADYETPVKFLPPGANANGLIVIDNVAYVVTQGNCGGAANGVWALDLVSKQITTWKANVAGIAGSAFGADGTLYVATGNEGESPNSLVALDPKTLSVKAWYSTGAQEFASSPVIFEHKGKTLIAAATKEGRIHLIDGATMGGSDHKTALYTTPASSKTVTAAPGALASWQDASGARWILAPGDSAVVAWKLVEENGALTLKNAWASPDLVSPLPPTIINGVVFVTSGGEGDSKAPAGGRARRSSRAVLYALDGETGKEIWNSGTTITSFARGAALSGGVGQIYITTNDGVIYAFGFPMEH